MLLYQIFRPIDYLRIVDQSKLRIDWAVPLFLAAFTALCFWFLPNKPQVFVKDGLLQQVGSFLSIMPGFYLAALAAIATFNKEDMDEYLPEPTPTVKTLSNGVPIQMKLTRRRYLSLMFGYLTLVSLILFVGTIFVNACAESIKNAVNAPARQYVVVLFVLIFFSFFWHMIIVTFFGLYQLSDRIHQPTNLPKE